jgi:hypothetical protein
MKMAKHEKPVSATRRVLRVTAAAAAVVLAGATAVRMWAQARERAIAAAAGPED